MLVLKQVSRNFGGLQALTEVDLVVSPHRIVGLIGPNAAGKSTLIKAILGLVPGSGRVLWRGQVLHRQRQRIAYVPQRSQIDWDYPVTAWNVVMMGQTPRLGWFRRPDKAAKAAAIAALERMEIRPLAHRPIGQLSGGQQQRVFLARALAQQADVFLLDEPFTGVDKKTEAVILGLFAELKSQGKTLLVCNHEWGEALQRYDRLLLLNRQLLANDTPQAVMTLDNIQRAYGEAIGDAATTGMWCYGV
jgi:manganese/iron transport system ATP-binding protein